MKPSELKMRAIFFFYQYSAPAALIAVILLICAWALLTGTADQAGIIKHIARY